MMNDLNEIEKTKILQIVDLIDIFSAKFFTESSYEMENFIRFLNALNPIFTLYNLENISISKIAKETGLEFYENKDYSKDLRIYILYHCEKILEKERPKFINNPNSIFHYNDNFLNYLNSESGYNNLDNDNSENIHNMKKEIQKETKKSISSNVSKSNNNANNSNVQINHNYTIYTNTIILNKNINKGKPSIHKKAISSKKIEENIDQDIKNSNSNLNSKSIIKKSFNNNVKHKKTSGIVNKVNDKDGDDYFENKTEDSMNSKKKISNIEYKNSFYDRNEKKVISNLFSNEIFTSYNLDETYLEIINSNNLSSRKRTYSYSKSMIEKSNQIKKEFNEFKPNYEKEKKNILNDKVHNFMNEHFPKAYDDCENFFLNIYQKDSRRKKNNNCIDPESIVYSEKNIYTSENISKNDTKTNIIDKGEENQESIFKECFDFDEGLIPRNKSLKLNWKSDIISNDELNNILYEIEKKNVKQKWSQEVILEMLMNFNYDKEILMKNIDAQNLGENDKNSKYNSKYSHDYIKDLVSNTDGCNTAITRRRLLLRSKVIK